MQGTGTNFFTEETMVYMAIVFYRPFLVLKRGSCVLPNILFYEFYNKFQSGDYPKPRTLIPHLIRRIEGRFRQCAGYSCCYRNAGYEWKYVFQGSV
jgi:hypothetical protein